MATFSEIFKPVDNDYGLISLRRVIGCTVDAVWKGTTCADAGMIATAAGVFNVAVAIIASILISYTLYVAVMETASEGEADRTLKSTSTTRRPSTSLRRPAVGAFDDGPAKMEMVA